MIFIPIAMACFSNAVGVADPPTIPGNHMTASTEFSSSYAAAKGRLNSYNAWCASSCCSSQEWLQVDLGKTTEICGVDTQGLVNDQYNSWVTDFKLSYSFDGSSWSTYKYSNGSEMVRLDFGVKLYRFGEIN